MFQPASSCFYPICPTSRPSRPGLARRVSAVFMVAERRMRADHDARLHPTFATHIQKLARRDHHAAGTGTKVMVDLRSRRLMKLTIATGPSENDGPLSDFARMACPKSSKSDGGSTRIGQRRR